MKKLIIICLSAMFCSNAQAHPVHMTETQVAHVLKYVGFSGRSVSVMTCIAKHESNFNPNALNFNSNRTTDHGLFQINDIWKRACRVTAQGLKNPLLNAECAAKVYREQGFNAWSAYKRYRRTCLVYRLPTERSSFLADLF